MKGFIAGLAAFLLIVASLVFAAFTANKPAADCPDRPGCVCPHGAKDKKPANYTGNCTDQCSHHHH